MNKYLVLRIVLVGLIVLSSAYCSSPDKKDTSESKDGSEVAAKQEPIKDIDARSEKMRSIEEQPKSEEQPLSQTEELLGYGELLDELSNKIKELRYPDGENIEGFEYKKWEIPNRKDFQNWLKGPASAIKDILEKLPASIKLEIVGHADSTGPEEKEGNKLGNIYYSQKRAEEVKKLIVKLLSSEKLKASNLNERILTRGAGSSELIPGIEGTSAKQRRVTFNILNQSEKELKPSPGASESDINSTK
jgi:outer membrane protein OmpA-like peptidoglycan-associated protein